MKPDHWVLFGKGLMILGLAVVGFGFMWGMKIEAQHPDQNPFAVQLVAVAIGFVTFTIGRWCAAKGQEQQ